MSLNVEQSREQDLECSQELLVNTNPGFFTAVLSAYKTFIPSQGLFFSYLHRRRKANTRQIESLLQPSFEPATTSQIYTLIRYKAGLPARKNKRGTNHKKEKKGKAIMTLKGALVLR